MNQVCGGFGSLGCKAPFTGSGENGAESFLEAYHAACLQAGIEQSITGVPQGEQTIVEQQPVDLAEAARAYAAYSQAMQAAAEQASVAQAVAAATASANPTDTGDVPIDPDSAWHMSREAEKRAKEKEAERDYGPAKGKGKQKGKTQNRANPYDEEEWICSHCDFSNRPDNRFCGGCSATKSPKVAFPKPMGGRSAEADGGGQSVSDALFGGGKKKDAQQESGWTEPEKKADWTAAPLESQIELPDPDDLSIAEVLFAGRPPYQPAMPLVPLVTDQKWEEPFQEPSSMFSSPPVNAEPKPTTLTDVLFRGRAPNNPADDPMKAAASQAPQKTELKDVLFGGKKPTEKKPVEDAANLSSMMALQASMAAAAQATMPLPLPMEGPVDEYGQLTPSAVAILAAQYAATAPEQPDGKWMCTCGFLNGANNKVCGGKGPVGCKTERALGIVPQQRALQAAIDSDQDWICPCGFVNKAKNLKCGGLGAMGCKQMRPDLDTMEALAAQQQILAAVTQAQIQASGIG